MKTPPAGRPRSAFSLPELMVAVGMIALLATLSAAAYPRALSRARSTACRVNLRQIGLALIVYADDNEGRLPTLDERDPSGAFRLLRTGLRLPEKSYRCPADRAGHDSGAYTSYVWNYRLNGRLWYRQAAEHHAGAFIMADGSEWHGYRNALFDDTRVGRLQPASE